MHLQLCEPTEYFMSIYRDNNPRTLEKPSILVGLMPFGLGMISLYLITHAGNNHSVILCNYIHQMLFKLIRISGCTNRVFLWQSKLIFWRDSVVHDKPTINERQKSDAAFAMMLDCVRHGCPTDETITMLQQCVIDTSEAKKIIELQQLDQAPVCLFPTRDMCKTLSNEMLQHLTTEVHELECTDENRIKKPWSS